MKRVALLMESWEKYFTYAWPSGIMDQFMKTGVKANLYVFNCNGLLVNGRHSVGQLCDVRMSKDGRYIVSCAQGGILAFWDAIS